MRSPTLAFTLAVAAAVVLAPVVTMAGGPGGPGGRPMAGGGAQGRALVIQHGAGAQTGTVGRQAPRVRNIEPVDPPAQASAPRNFVSGPSARNVATPGVTVASWVYASPVVYAAPPAYDPGPPVYEPAPVSYSPPLPNVIVYAPSPPPSPMPTVVEFSTGRYELRGDGITTGYFWVWIPNPPTAPPSVALIPEDPPRAGLQPLYRWIDEAGVTHWTDRRAAVPEQHRAEAELPRIP